MARKRSGRPAHKFGDRPPGLRHELRGDQVIKIGDEILVTICRERGKFVSYVKSPPALTTIETRKTTCKTLAKRNN